MLIRKAPDVRSSEITPKNVYLRRREFLQASAAALVAAGYGSLAGPADAQARTKLKGPIKKSPLSTLGPNDKVNPYEHVTTYNNFYEFGSQKTIWRAAQALPIRPWTVTLDGLVKEPKQVAIDDLLKAMPLEERLYRHRCVEAWAMAVPWSGFALKALVDYAEPLASAKYLRMETFLDVKVAPGQKQRWYPWPYIEGLTMAEATNELAFIATGVYGKPMPPQNGSPLRLAVPWKYGFKSTKSIVKFTFTEERPVSFWEEIQPQEYGFWANVNPQVSHPRWSQAKERMLGTGEYRPTLLYNGYGEQVAELYKGLERERLFM